MKLKNRNTKKTFDIQEGIQKDNEVSSSEEEVDIEHNINIEDNIKKNNRNSVENEEKNEIKFLYYN